MIDFKNAAAIELGPCDPSDIVDEIAPLLLPDERVVIAQIIASHSL